jgi:protein transport protein SEC61 subunit alpha
MFITAIVLFVTLGISLAYVPSMFMSLQSGDYISILVVLQLFIGSTIIYFLEQILDNYGMCPVFTLYFSANACKVIFWQAFSPITVDTGRGPEFEGSVLCFVHLIFSWTNKSMAVREAILRKNQPNLMTLGSTIFIFIAIIYLQGIIH